VRLPGQSCVRPTRDITLRHDLHALSKFFGYAVNQRWAGDNPVHNVTIPSDADAIRIHVLTFEEERKYFLHAAKHRDLNDLGRLILNQGMRPDEVTCLRKADVDLDRGPVTHNLWEVTGGATDS
jgi:site-specific recombinase XerD